MFKILFDSKYLHIIFFCLRGFPTLLHASGVLNSTHLDRIQKRKEFYNSKLVFKILKYVIDKL
jgi:hypothetical protein